MRTPTNVVHSYPRLSAHSPENPPLPASRTPLPVCPSAVSDSSHSSPSPHPHTQHPPLPPSRAPTPSRPRSEPRHVLRLLPSLVPQAYSLPGRRDHPDTGSGLFIISAGTTKVQTARTSHLDGSWLRGSLKPGFPLVVLIQDRRVTLSLGALSNVALVCVSRSSEPRVPFSLPCQNPPCTLWLLWSCHSLPLQGLFFPLGSRPTSSPFRVWLRRHFPQDAVPPHKDVT